MIELTMPARWTIVAQNPPTSLQELRSILCANRNISSQQSFFNPSIQHVSLHIPGIQSAKTRVQHAIKKQEKIIVYSDYDADGICGVAILWRTLHRLGAHALPFVPHRQIEGYGLQPAAVEKLAADGAQLIITVDCGITSTEGVVTAKRNGVDVIITDHHAPPPNLPPADHIVHETRVCGAGVAWKLSQVLTDGKDRTTDIDLVALATIADMVPLQGENRILAMHGLEKMRQTSNVGLRALLLEAGVNLPDLEPFHLGFILAPRINALGRLSHALDALRLLCTQDKVRANTLARILGAANTQRQLLTMETVTHARSLLEENGELHKQKTIILGHPSWHQGIIGLVASRLTELYHRPTIIVSKGKKISKGSCRSIPAVNMITLLREMEDLFIDVGGHPMAAGFTIRNDRLPLFARTFTATAEKKIHRNDLHPSLTIDTLLPPTFFSLQTIAEIRKFSPFGIGNQEPVFCSRKIRIRDIRRIGQTHQHLKLSLADFPDVDVIGFKKADLGTHLRPGDSVDLAYTLQENTWGGKTRVQLKLKDMQKS